VTGERACATGSLGKLDGAFPMIGFGVIAHGGLLAQDGAGRRSLRTLVRLRCGINFYDTADMYSQGGKR